MFKGLKLLPGPVWAGPAPPLCLLSTLSSSALLRLQLFLLLRLLPLLLWPVGGAPLSPPSQSASGPLQAACYVNVYECDVNRMLISSHPHHTGLSWAPLTWWLFILFRVSVPFKDIILRGWLDPTEWTGRGGGRWANPTNPVRSFQSVVSDLIWDLQMSCSETSEVTEGDNHRKPQNLWGHHNKVKQVQIFRRRLVLNQLLTEHKR